MGSSLLTHFLFFSLRSFTRQKLHTALTIAVLSLGLGCFIAAALFALHLDSFDRQFRNYDRTYVVYQSVDWPIAGQRMPLGPRASPAMAEQLEIDVPELAAVARAVQSGVTASVDGGEGSLRRVSYVDPEFFEIFDFHAVTGDLRAALAQPRTAVLSENAATELFGSSTAAIGRTLSVAEQGNRADLTVIAVTQEIAGASHLASGQFSVSFEIFVPWSTLEQIYGAVMNVNSWIAVQATVYAMLPADGSYTVEDLDARLRAFGDRELPEQGAKVAFAARPLARLMKDRVQQQLQGSQTSAVLPIDVAHLLLLFAGLILGVACLNFINLTTVRSAARAREIGVRKALGAATRSVVEQDLVQTAVTVLAAIGVALALIVALSWLLAERWRVVIAPPWSSPELWALLAGVLITVTVVAGAYPAAVLARANPSTALRLGTAKAGSSVLRAFLVGTQFASAAFLIIAAIVFYSQAQAVRAGALGRFADQYVVLPQNFRGTRIDFEVVESELLRGAGIKAVAGISGYPYRGDGGGALVSRSAQQAAPVMMQLRYVTHDYFKVMEIPLLAGRSFSKDRADDVLPAQGEERTRGSPPRIVIDRRAAAALGWTDPQAAVGEFLHIGGNVRGPGVEIVGVVESLPLSLRSQGDSAFLYFLAPQFAFSTLVRVAPADVAAALPHIDAVTKRLAPDTAVVRRFLDEVFESTYAAFTMANRVVLGVAILAMIIAGIGLFGMASFMTRRRTREIGVRKAHGARSAKILTLLLRDFAKPVLIANVVVWPLAYVAARAYLDLFLDRMTLTPLPFAAALAGTALLAWLVVGAHAARAARLNPALALRDE